MYPLGAVNYAALPMVVMVPVLMCSLVEQAEPSMGSRSGMGTRVLGH